jgi:hypothetical protein
MRNGLGQQPVGVVVAVSTISKAVENRSKMRSSNRTAGVSEFGYESGTRRRVCPARKNGLPT